MASNSRLPQAALNPRDDPTSPEYEFYPDDNDDPAAESYSDDPGSGPRRLPRLPWWMASPSLPENSAKEVLRRRAEQLPRHFTRAEYDSLNEYIQNIFVVGSYGQSIGMLLGAGRWMTRPNWWPFGAAFNMNTFDDRASAGGGGGPFSGGSKPPGSPVDFRSGNRTWGFDPEQQRPQALPPPPPAEGPVNPFQLGQGKQHHQQPPPPEQSPGQAQGQSQRPRKPSIEDMKRIQEILRQGSPRERISTSIGLAARLASYMFVGHLLGGILGITFGGAWMSSEEAQDPRLARYHHDRKTFIAHEQQRARAEAAERQQRMAGHRAPQVPPSDQDADPIGLYGDDNSEQRTAPASTPISRSPVSFRKRAESKSADNDMSLGGATADTEIFWGDDVRSESSEKTTGGSSWSDRSNQIQRSQESQRERSSRQPQSSRTSSREEPSSAYESGGSAWERLRKEAVDTQSDAPHESAWSRARGSSVPSGRGQSKQDSFTFSDSERSRSFAKEEAQKDFDERVEKERRGEEGWK